MGNVIKINNVKKCSGCSACYNICPADAINMIKDQEGFVYPEINKKKCLNCGKCKSVCPYYEKIEIKEDLEICYAAYNKDEKIREKSSSGGIFALIARKIIEENGVVYGAAFDDSFMVYHKGIENYEDIDELIGSKYLQSNMGYCYRDVLNQLNFGKKVLFVGTSCQIGGLKNFLGREYDYLICVDFICLGIPSPQIWKDYLDTYFKDEKITYVNFKDKKEGWNKFSLTINGKKQFSQIGKQTIFFAGYFKGLYSRPACSECIFKSDKRVSDLTLSDCWGYMQIAPELNDNKGLSCIVCHSNRGVDIFEKIISDIYWKKINLEDIKKYNSNYNISTPMGEKRDSFWKDYNRMSKRKLFCKYCKPEKENLIKNFIFGVKKIMRKMIRRVR